MNTEEFKRTINFLNELKKLIPPIENKRDYTLGAVEDLFKELRELCLQHIVISNDAVLMYTEQATGSSVGEYRENLIIFYNEWYLYSTNRDIRLSRNGETVETNLYTAILGVIDKAREKAFETYQKPNVYITDRLPLLVGDYKIAQEGVNFEPSRILYELHSDFEKQSMADAVNLLLDTNFNKNPRFDNTKVYNLDDNEIIYVFIPKDKFEKIELDNIEEVGYNWFKITKIGESL